MIAKYIIAISVSLLLAGCHVSSNTEHEQHQSKAQLILGDPQKCGKYSGLPHHWGKDKHAGMVWIPEGSFELGSNIAYPDELNFGEKKRKISGFWIDQTEVTVAQFASFVNATHY